MDWHPSYDKAVARLHCPQCGAPAGQWCQEEPERDLHTARILLACNEKRHPMLTPEDHAEIAALTGQIMHLVDNCPSTADLRQSITDLLTRRIEQASRPYEQQLAAEETHDYGIPAAGNPAPPPHPIDQCSLAYCGRYRGQRRGDPIISRKLDAELFHTTVHNGVLTKVHDISDCSPDYCGRHRGQRRGSDHAAPFHAAPFPPHPITQCSLEYCGRDRR